VFDLHRNGIVPLTNIVEHVDFTKLKADGSLLTEVKNDTLNYRLRTCEIGVSSVYTNEPRNDSHVIDESTMPPREYALYLDGTNSNVLKIPAASDFRPSNENGYTWIIGINTTTNRPFVNEGLFRHDGSSQAYIRLNTNSGDQIVYFGAANNPGDEWSHNKPTMISIADPGTTIPLSYVNGFNWAGHNSHIDFASLPQSDFYIGRRSATNDQFEGYMFYFALVKGVLTQKELLELSNNTLIKNPSIAIQNKYELELFVDFNNPYEDTGVLYFPDLSPNNYDVIAEGWDNLNDLTNSLRPIKDLIGELPEYTYWVDEDDAIIVDQNDNAIIV
jgi:hypothetical protein